MPPLSLHSAGLQGHGSGADTAARTPAAAPTPATAALAVAAAPRRRGCASLERRGPRDGRAGAARTSSPPPPSPCGRTSRRARPQRAAQGGAPLGAAVWPSTAASSSRRARRRPWASVAAATARAAAAGVGAAAGVRAAASAPLQWPWRPAEGATRGAARIACISAKKITVPTYLPTYLRSICLMPYFIAAARLAPSGAAARSFLLRGASGARGPPPGRPPGGGAPAPRPGKLNASGSGAGGGGAQRGCRKSLRSYSAEYRQ